MKNSGKTNLYNSHTLDMDPATAIALCKENIQPLRHGRNVMQLGTALRAQEDTEAQQTLLQEKQMYEDAIKNYAGDDPLENWYEYILWTEQSYPKSGHESHIGKILQQCLATFEKDPKYHQDRRYVRLWINYISMQKNPLELYQLLYNNGIGTMVADMYRAWAFELEQMEDYKRADEVYMMGMVAHAEPREELDYAHKNFQLALGRRMLGRDDDRSEIPLSEQRQAFSSLRAIKAGRRVTNVRTGHRVRDYLPGVVPQTAAMNHGARSNARIQIYQDEHASVDAKAASILDHVPIEEAMHKENTIKPGPWNNGAKKCPLISSSVKPSFKVHEDQADDNYDVEHVRLFPNHTPFFDGGKYPEHTMVPVYVPETANAGFILKPHYPKELVYANNIDCSMEELRAEKYLQRYSGNREKKSMAEPLLAGPAQERETNGAIAPRQTCEAELQEIERREKRKFEQEEMAQQRRQQQRQMEQQRRDTEQYELQRQRLQAEQQLLQRQRYEADSLKLEKERREAEQRELERRRNEQLELERRRNEQLEIERQRREAELERQRYEAKQLKALEAVRIEAERIEAERIEAQRMEAELQNSQRKPLAPSFLLHRHHTPSVSSESEEHLLGQSLTVNTKEAMSVVQDLWHSPSLQSPAPIINRPMAHRVPETRTKLTFDIHMDSSMTQQHALSATKNDHHSSNPSYHVQTYQDQENHQRYHSPYQSHEAQPYSPHGIPDPYQYQVPIQHHDHRVQHHHHHHHHHPQQHQHHQQQQHHQQHNDRSGQQHQAHILASHQQLAPMMHQGQSSASQLQIHGPQQQHHQQLHHASQSQQSHNSSHQQVQPQIHQSPQLHPHHQPQHHPHHHLHHHSHHSPHLQQQAHHSRHSQPTHESPHSQHLQASPHVHQQHMYGAASIPAANMGPYHQSPYSMNLQCPPPPSQQHAVENDKQSLHFTPYIDAEADSNKTYRMPDQLPHIKSPGMNRRDLKYLENADNKENASVPVDCNNSIEGGVIPKQADENLYADESLGTAPLSNDTCFTEAFTTPLVSSTPLTNQYKHAYRTKDIEPSYPVQNVSMMPQQGTSDLTAVEPEKLSVIMESTREYVSSSSGSSVHTRTVGLAFASTRDELLPIKEQSTTQDPEVSDNTLLLPHKSYEDQMRAKIQAVHAQSPRTVQRNVDQITTEIKNNCDLRIPFKLKSEPANDEPKVDTTMDCEFPEPMEQVEEEEFVLPTDINPFDKVLIGGLLRKIKFPQSQHMDGYVRLNINLNKVVPSSMITLGTEAYDVERCVGKGTYGTVVKATDLQTRQTVALKTQKPAWVWEYYIAREIKARLSNPHMLRGFMDITRAYVTDNGSVLVSQFSKYGTLLAVTNQVKMATGKPLVECLAIFFTIEVLQIVEYLHKCQIIHADIKPDNFLLMHLPTEDVRPTIQLIDFGCSIDMSLLPKDTKFHQIIKTEEFTCIEMQTGRPWTYQTDLYCVAGLSHCLLFGNYMRVSHNGTRWSINSKLPRYAKKAAWEMFFTKLLNIESCDDLPDLSKIRNVMEESLSEMSEFQGKIRHFANVLNRR